MLVSLHIFYSGFHLIFFKKNPQFLSDDLIFLHLMIVFFLVFDDCATFVVPFDIDKYETFVFHLIGPYICNLDLLLAHWIVHSRSGFDSQSEHMAGSDSRKIGGLVYLESHTQARTKILDSLNE